MASATSYLAPSPSYHVPVRPSYVLRREGESEAWRESVYSFQPVPDPDRPGEYVRVSGAGSDRERQHSLRLLTDHFFSGADPLVRQLRGDQFDPGRRTGIVVNSYEQVAFIKAYLRRTSSLAHRVIGVTSDIRKIPSAERSEWVSASQVETLGTRDDWDAIVFPMKAIGRGVNIVFADGHRVRDAVLGNVAFFIRPHPTADSLAFTGGLAGQLALQFDRRGIPPDADIARLVREWRGARDEALDSLRWLLRRPQQISRLGRMMQPFVADGMVDLLQTIGRAMRNGCKTRVFFVDASFAPNSAKDRRDNAVFAYVDLDMVNDASDAFEQISRRIESSVFKGTVRTGEEFSSVITAWLGADDRRRLLLLIDEADKFVRKEAETDFRCIKTLLQLMGDTRNRFKFVLAGLHNVSRMVRAENSPLVQISNNPLQIGPLLNRDVDDAEFLVRGPLAAMGFEFDKHEDVWRILTFTNYYPVLIQVFCQELLRLIHDHAQKTGQLPGTISASLAERALSSSDVRSKLFGTFQKTIGDIEGRYELITYILAARELVERDSGMVAEGMTAAEVAERAMEYWPAAFPRGTDPNELEYLLEEMEGFGIARRTVAGSFALRSRSLLELMAATEDDLTRKLESYKSLKPPPKSFDPKNFRRPLGKPLPGVDSVGRISPLTDGQEADLLAPFQIAVGNGKDESIDTQPSGGVGVVFGTESSGIRFVEAALLDAGRVKDKLVDVELKTYQTKKEMLDDAKRAPKTQRPRVVVVSSKTAWRPDWVVEAERIGRVRKGAVRLVFIGDPVHAGEWSKDRTVLHRVLPQIKIVKLRPWARSYLGNRIESLQIPGELLDRILQVTGGWSETAGPLLSRIAQEPAQASALIAKDAVSVLASPGLLDRLGIPRELVGFFRELAAYADGSTITTTDFQNLCTFDDRKISPRVVGIYSDLLGIISFPPDQSGQGHRKVDLNPLVHAALLRPE
jgi:hypothetical protein